MQKNLVLHAAPAPGSVGGYPWISCRFSANDNSIYITPPRLGFTPGRFSFPGICFPPRSGNAAQRTRSASQDTTPAHYRPVILCWFLWGRERLYKRFLSLCYPYTRNAYKRRCGHSVAAGRHSRCAAWYRATAGRVPEIIHPGLWRPDFWRFSGLFLEGLVWRKIGPDPQKS